MYRSFLFLFEIRSMYAILSYDIILLYLRKKKSNLFQKETAPGWDQMGIGFIFFSKKIIHSYRGHGGYTHF